MAFAPDAYDSENTLVDLHVADKICAYNDHTESKDLPSPLSAHIFAVHHLDWFECILGGLDGNCYR